MIIELMKDDKIAIKTAKLSATKTQLNPTTNCLLTIILLSAKVTGNIYSEQTNEVNIKANESKFLNRNEILPINGKTNAPNIGTKTALISIDSYLITKVCL